MVADWQRAFVAAMLYQRGSYNDEEDMRAALVRADRLINLANSYPRTGG